MVTAYFLAKLYVFKKSSQSNFRSAVFFIFVNLLAVAQTWLISVGLVTHVFSSLESPIFSEELAHAIGIVVPVLTSYFGHKKWSFRE